MTRVSKSSLRQRCGGMKGKIITLGVTAMLSKIIHYSFIQSDIFFIKKSLEVSKSFHSSASFDILFPKFRHVHAMRKLCVITEPVLSLHDTHTHHQNTIYIYIYNINFGTTSRTYEMLLK